LVQRPVPAQYAHFGSVGTVTVVEVEIVDIWLVDNRFTLELYLSLSFHQSGDPEDPCEL